MPIGSCWASGSWIDDAWAAGTWADTQVCPPAPIGTVWASGSWLDTAWCMDTWANGSTPPTPGGGTLPRISRRVYVAPPVIDWQGNIRRKREEEEIVIL